MCKYGGNARKLCKVDGCEDCYFKSFKSSPKMEFWDEECELNPGHIFNSSGKKIKFHCKVCQHYFISSPHNLNGKNAGCPYCNSYKLCDDENCIYCFDRSFKSCEKWKFWSGKNKLSPRQVLKNTHEKYYFDCNACKHTFLAILRDVSRGHWCPYCCTPTQKLCENDNCDFCEKNSFRSHPRSKNLSTKNGISARMISLHSNMKCLFDCECGHEFEANIDHVSRGHWCSYCCIPTQKLCDDENCNHCLNRSFAIHAKSVYICKESGINPRNITLNSNIKIPLKCNDCGFSFNMSPADVNFGRWCSACVNKTEKIIFDFLQEKNVKFHYQYSAEWTKNPETNQYFKIDYFLPDHNLALELDGRQHFRQVSNWTSNEKTRERDVTKMLMAYKQGITTMRILQEDVFYNRRDWKRDLSRLVRNYTPAGVIMVSNENEYSQHYLDFVKVTNEPNRCFMFK